MLATAGGTAGPLLAVWTTRLAGSRATADDLALRHQFFGPCRVGKDPFLDEGPPDPPAQSDGDERPSGQRPLAAEKYAAASGVSVR